MPNVDELPILDYQAFLPTRNYVQNVAKILGKAQQVFLDPEPHEWHRGLEVIQGGLQTQSFDLRGVETNLTMNMVTGVVKARELTVQLTNDVSPESIRQSLTTWFETQGQGVAIPQPDYSTGPTGFDIRQAQSLNAAFWWIFEQLGAFKSTIQGGQTSPVLLFPHHFDLSLVWFPGTTQGNEQRQLSFGFSSGDETITEPYVYITAYPEPEAFKDLALPADAFWQQQDFSGTVLPYARLQQDADPVQKLHIFMTAVLSHTRSLSAWAGEL